MLDQVKLLIAGTPTRAFQPSPKIKKFMNELPAKALQGFKVASFDTRADETDINNRLLKFLIKTFGYAAEPLAKKLKRKGGHLISKPEGFFIQDTEGPLKKDELERAEEWGRQIRDL
jgi:flavodoxin